tara:strand:+ start:1244 stop:1777 length:534 start_codon:yes stop_codon:yes gene_type:complete
MPHYFSYDDEGAVFFDTIKELLNSPARKEDMYVYNGELDEENYDDNADDYREVSATEFLETMTDEVLEENDELKDELKQLKEENEKLKKENEEHTYTLQSKEHAINVNHNTLWKMTREIRQLKDQLDLSKKRISPFDNYDELDKYINHLKKKNETWSKRCLEAEALTDKKLKEETSK